MTAVSLDETSVCCSVQKTGHMRNLFLTIIYLLAGPFVLLSQRYLAISYDSLVICHYRALAGCLALFALAYFVDRQGLTALLRQPQRLGVIAICGILLGAAALLLLEGMRHAGTLSASLTGIVGMPFLTLISLAMFGEERPKHIYWLATGVLLSTLGAAGYAYMGRSFDMNPQFGYGILLLALAVVASLIHIPLSRHAVRTSSPLATAAIMQAVAMVGFLVAAVLQGKYRSPVEIGIEVMFWMVLSGSLGMLVGAGLGMVILKRIGVVRRQILHLCMPPLVGVFAYLIFGESIALHQIPYIILLLAGCGCVVGAGRQYGCVTASR